MSKKPDYCPDWFDLDNYEPCNRFTRQAWKHALMFRLLVYNNINSTGRRSNIEKNLEVIRFMSSYESNEVNNKQTVDNHETGKLSTGSVRNIQLDDFCGIYESVISQYPKLVDYIEECIKEAKLIGVDDEGYRYSWVDTFSEEDAGVNLLDDVTESDQLTSYVYIDLRTNNDKILADFESWLKEKRESLKKTPLDNYQRVSDAELKKYVQYKMLAYIDLFLWCELTKEPLTQTQIGNLLFPDEFDVNLGERIRTAIAPKAKRLLRLSYRLLD